MEINQIKKKKNNLNLYNVRIESLLLLLKPVNKYYAKQNYYDILKTAPDYQWLYRSSADIFHPNGLHVMLSIFGTLRN